MTVLSRAVFIASVAVLIAAGQPRPGFQGPPPAAPDWARPKPLPPEVTNPAPAPAKVQDPAKKEQASEQKPAQATAPARDKDSAKPGGLVLNIPSASLVDVIEILAKRLQINYILDPRVAGTVTIHTFGEVKEVDARALLETVLRINGAAMVQVGDIYRIVPAAEVARLPLTPQVDPREFSPDDRMMLNMVFLKYATVGDVSKLLQPFLGEGAQITVYEPANLLLILDNSRNMRRTMEMIAMFDSDVLAGQRVRVFEVKHGRPSDLARELEQVLKAISLGGEKTTPVRFLPIDRINTVVAIAPNPGVFDQVRNWLDKLDIVPKATSGAMNNYVYRVKYGRAEMLAMAITQLYMGSLYPGYGMGYGMGMYGGGMYGGGMYGGGMYGGGMYGAGMYGGGMYAPGMAGGGMYGGGMYGGGMGGMYGGGMYGGGMGYGMPYQSYAPPPVPFAGGGVPQATAQAGATGTTGSGSTTTAGSDLTGSYLGASASAYSQFARIPRVIPNPFDNTLLIQATPEDHVQVTNLLRQLDVPPRQILVEARIYEVNMNGEFSSGVQAYLRRRTGADRMVQGSLATNAAGALQTTLTGGLLVGNSRELLATVVAAEHTGRAKLVSAPSIIATDSVPATMNVGEEVPTLSAQAVNGGLQSGGSSVFTQAITNRQTGVTLNVLARVNPSGIVTMVINQEVSAPQAPPEGSSIASPSFSKRTLNTQITVEDGDTIAIGGIISESDTFSSAGVPVLHRIPILGGAFGSKTYSKQRTELVIFMTPRIIYDTAQMTEASDELKSRFKKLNRLIPD